MKAASFKVTDNGKGELTVERVGDETKPMFEFTNAYSVTPVDSSVTDQIPVSKSLVGREQESSASSFSSLLKTVRLWRGARMTLRATCP